MIDKIEIERDTETGKWLVKLYDSSKSADKPTEWLLATTVAQALYALNTLPVLDLSK